jgi:hypothetical protein
MKAKAWLLQRVRTRSTHLSEPTRRFLRGLLVFMLALGSLIALSARGQTNYTGAYYFTTLSGAAIGADGTGRRPPGSGG